MPSQKELLVEPMGPVIGYYGMPEPDKRGRGVDNPYSMTTQTPMILKHGSPRDPVMNHLLARLRARNNWGPLSESIIQLSYFLARPASSFPEDGIAVLLVMNPTPRHPSKTLAFG